MKLIAAVLIVAGMCGCAPSSDVYITRVECASIAERSVRDAFDDGLEAAKQTQRFREALSRRKEDGR